MFFLVTTLLLVSAERHEHPEKSPNDLSHALSSVEELPNSTVLLSSLRSIDRDQLRRAPHIMRRPTASPAQNRRNAYTIKLRERIVEISGSELTAWPLPPTMKVHTPCLKFGLSCPSEYVNFLEDILRQALRENPMGKESIPEGCDVVSLNVKLWVLTGNCVPVDPGVQESEESYWDYPPSNEADHPEGSDPARNTPNRGGTRSSPSVITTRMTTTPPISSFPDCVGCGMEQLTHLENLQQYVRVLEDKLARIRHERWCGAATQASSGRDGDWIGVAAGYLAWGWQILQVKTGIAPYTRCARQTLERWFIEAFLRIDAPLVWGFYWVSVRLLPCAGVVAFGVWVWSDVPWPDSVLGYVLNLTKTRPDKDAPETTETRTGKPQAKPSVLGLKSSPPPREMGSPPLSDSHQLVDNGVVDPTWEIGASGTSTEGDERGSTSSPLQLPNNVRKGSEREDVSKTPLIGALQTNHAHMFSALNQVQPPQSERAADAKTRRHHRRVAVSFTLLDDFFNIDSSYFLLLRLRVALCLLTLLSLLWCGYECYRNAHRIFSYNRTRDWGGFDSGEHNSYGSTVNQFHVRISSAISACTRLGGRFLQRLLPQWLSVSIGLYVLYSFLGSVVLVALRETCSAFQELLEEQSESAIRQVPILRLDSVEEME
ncbi:unnamed protein product [Phytomonas sp. EM1]|nr:unnamed protein product [Phytomonas sp. EM1]|eukprot:CCW59634.1 unnamed protein product [Phytomonas sp. isolate EM1]